MQDAAAEKMKTKPDDDNDFYKTGAKLLLHQNSSQSSYFSINDCNFNFANETDTVLLFSKTRHFRH